MRKDNDVLLLFDPLLGQSVCCHALVPSLVLFLALFEIVSKKEVWGDGQILFALDKNAHTLARASMHKWSGVWMVCGVYECMHTTFFVVVVSLEDPWTVREADERYGDDNSKVKREFWSDHLAFRSIEHFLLHTTSLLIVQTFPTFSFLIYVIHSRSFSFLSFLFYSFTSTLTLVFVITLTTPTPPLLLASRSSYCHSHSYSLDIQLLYPSLSETTQWFASFSD